MITAVKRAGGRLWGSPTVTAWSAMAGQSLRLLVLMPLILKKFDEAAVASWLLFGSIMFVGSLLANQIVVLFSRMIALAMGGATDLSPIVHGSSSRGSGIPNWFLVKRVFGTASTAVLFVALLSLTCASLMGAWGLRGIVEDSASADKIWWAFYVMLLGDSIVQVFQRYAIVLRGMNYVALVNRWDALFALASASAGALVLILGGGIFELACVMQTVLFVGAVRYWLIIRHLGIMELTPLPRLCLDKEVLLSAWKPLIKSLMQSFANMGAIRLSTVVYARYADASSVAALLLVLRLYDVSWMISSAPLTSKVPIFARMLAEGQLKSFRERVMRALCMSRWLLVLGCLLAAGAGGFVLSLINSEGYFLPWDQALLFALVYVVVAGTRQDLVVSVIGNNVVAAGRYAVAAILTALLSPYFIDKLGFWGFLMVAYAPTFILVNFSPLKSGANLLGIAPWVLFRKAIFFPMLAFACGAVIVVSLNTIIL